MANALFDAYREDCLDSSAPDLTSDTIKLTFVDEGDDTPVPATDDFYDDIAAAARVAASGGFTSKTITGGVFDAVDETVSAVSGDIFESIVIWEDSGVESTSSLIAYIDSATGLPATPNGGDITVQWSAGADKIFKL